jgi:hypothetical protein
MDGEVRGERATGSQERVLIEFLGGKAKRYRTVAAG